MLRPLFLLLATLALGTAAEVENRNVADPSLAPTLRESQLFTARITVRNPNDRAVKVKQIDTTCTCSKLELGSRFLLPGATTTLEMAVKNAMRSGLQTINISLFLSDPDLEPIEVQALWNVVPAVAVDGIPPADDPLPRPADRLWQDIYRYVMLVRPDEPQRLRKRIRLESPAGEVPAGGLKVEGIDYAGKIWQFAAKDQGNGSILVTAGPRDAEADLPLGEFDEPVVIRTNHPDKPRIEVRFQTTVSRDAGKQAIDPMMPLPMPGPR